jgi:hypothetical protein
MTNNDEHWLTAGEAARLLHMSERQAHRYGQSGRIRIRKAGRRVLYLASDVTSLADELRVDIKPAPAQRGALLPPEMVRYLQEQEERMRQQGETQATIDRRLEAIEQRLGQPQTAQIPLWLVIVLVVLVVLSVAIVVLLVIGR